MKTMELSKAAVEINEIFENMSPELLEKIPKEEIIYYSKIASEEYKWHYDKTKKIGEQKISKITQKILGDIYDKYIYNKRDIDMWKFEENKKKESKYDVNIFKNEKAKKENSMQLIEINNKQDSIFKRIFNKIKSWIKQEHKIKK